MVLDLADLPDGFLEDPYPVYDRLLEAGLVWQSDGSAIVARHEDLQRIYKDTRRFLSDKKRTFGTKFGAGSPLFRHHTTSLVFNDAPLHTRVRRIMSAAMAPRAIARMEPGLVTVVDGLLDRMAGRIDLIEDYAAAIPVQVIGNLLDVPLDDRRPLRDWSLAILGALEPVVSEAAMARGHAAVEAFGAYLEGLIAARRARPGNPEEDVLTRLIAGDSEGQLSGEELVQNCIFILNAGHETTTNLIGSGLALFHDHPDAFRALKADPEGVNLAVEEVLRVASPNQFGNREVAQAVEICGEKVPVGTNLHLCIGAANRDPRVFQDPARFDILRRPNGHLAFAGGPHVCVGLTLARMEARIALGHFIARFPNYRIAERQLGRRVRFRGYERLVADLGD